MMANTVDATQTAQTATGTSGAVPQSNAPATDEALTGRQLRIARRIAQKNGIQASSDLDAVKQLRDRGIDPFARSNVLQLVTGAGDGAAEPATAAAAPTKNLPAVPSVAPPPAAPAGVVMDDAERAAEIMRIQRDIAKRRRRKMALLAVRLAFFVGLPTLIAGWYYSVLATPMYATKTEFVIQQADAASAAAAGGLGGLFAGTGLASQQDSIAVQGYLLSRDAYQRLDADHGFSAHFAADGIDALQRLDPDATQEQGYKLYQRMVEIGYDPTEGVVRMEVVAANPAVSEAFSKALLTYAEEQVDQLTSRLRSDQMQGAEDSFSDAERKMQEAQNRVVELQEQLGVVSAESELGNIYGQIGAIETTLREERLSLETLLSNRRPNQARVTASQNRIAQLEFELSTLRQSLTETGNTQGSLARVTAELGVAEMDLATRQLLLQQSAQQLETARIEANRQVRYLSTPVPPIAPDEPTYPRAVENTILAMLIFSAIYLMISLTAAILREQVSS
jgi:capsular polysaccharide transport system permease protein